MADNDIVIVGIGHSTLHENAQSQLLKDPTLLSLAQSDSAYNPKLNRVTEYRYCASLALLIVKELSKLGITGLTSNRYNNADIIGGSQIERDMYAEIKAINQALPAYGSRVKAAINLHLNATPGGRGYESYSPDTEIGRTLGQLFDTNIVNVLGIKNRGAKYSNISTKNLPGMGFPRSVRVPAVLLELFFIDNNEELLKGLQLKQQIAQAIAYSFKQFCDKDFPPFDASKALSEANVQSTALIQDKLSTKFNDEQVKTVALETQEKLLPIERELGESGDKYVFHNKNSIEVVGTKPPPFESTLIDPNGNVTTNLVLRSGGTVVNQKTYPLFQNVDYTSDVPTGKKSVFVNTLYELKSYETNLDSAAHMRLNAGGNLRITSAQQIDLVSAYNLNLVGDSIITISSNNIALQGNTSVSGTLGVDGSFIVGGVSYSQGGFYGPSFNGPAVIDKTNSQELYGYAASDNLQLTLGPCTLQLAKPIAEGDTSIQISSGIIPITAVNSGLGENSAALITLPPHCHYFKRLNGTLANSVVDIQSAIAPSING